MCKMLLAHKERTLIMPKLTKKVTALIITLFIIIGTISFYQLYWIRTPLYSLRQAQKALNAHDLTTFEQYVDLSSVYSLAFDDLTIYSLESKPELRGHLQEPMVRSLLSIIKNAVVPKLIANTQAYVSTGSWEADKAQQGVKPQPEDESPQDFHHKAGTQDLRFKSFGAVNITNDVAIAEINVIDATLSQPFTLKVQLLEQENHTWKVTKITNLQEYLAAYDAAKKAVK